LVTCKNAINPSVTNGAITAAVEMHFRVWFEPYICLALALFLIWDFGSVTMPVMMVATLIAIVVLNVED